MNHGSLFSGIGGFDLAAEWMGWKNLFNCEWEEFPRKVLKHHFPNAEQYGDIREFNATDYAGRIDILSGGFPCQPYSTAGKRLGKEDERHLWPEMLRIVRECSPRWIVGENVRGLVNWNGGMVFEEVCADLEACGYSVQPFVLPACAVNAPHRRDRVWFVAHNHNRDGQKKRFQAGRQVDVYSIEGNGNAPNTKSACRGRKLFKGQGQGKFGGCNSIGNAPDTNNKRLQRSKKPRGSKGGGEKRNKQLARRICSGWENFPTESPICGGNDGLPKELDGITFSKWRRESIKAYGNAIVPQVALRIFEAIQEYEISTKSPPPCEELSPHHGK